jgi:hypothetical protein
MSRPAKPYLHRSWWAANVGGTRNKLCRQEAGPQAARGALDDLKQQRRQNGGRTFPHLRVAELFALSLDTVKVERSEATYLDYRRWLTDFARLHRKC